MAVEYEEYFGIQVPEDADIKNNYFTDALFLQLRIIHLISTELDTVNNAEQYDGNKAAALYNNLLPQYGILRDNLDLAKKHGGPVDLISQIENSTKISELIRSIPEQ